MLHTTEALHYGTREQETFLPHGKPAHVNSAYFPLTPIPPISVDTPTIANDVDTAREDFDPFKARQLEHPISSYDTWIHIVRSSLGIRTLDMPLAFKASGLWTGVFTISLVSIICTHCAHMLVTSAHALYKKSRTTSMSYADVTEEAFLRGPQCTRKYSFIARQIVLWSIFIIYYSAGSGYVIYFSHNFDMLAYDYFGPFDYRIITIVFFLPLLIMAYVPNLKYLAIISMVTNTFIVTAIGVTCYYHFTDIPAIYERPAWASISTLPLCITRVIFTIEVIGVIMPLENNMKSPQKIIANFGVLNQGMTFVIILNLIVGFFGYLKYGEHVEDFPMRYLSVLQQNTLTILMGLGVVFSYGLVFYICFDIFWNTIKHLCSTRQKVANYFFRTVLVGINVATAIFMPEIGRAFMSLVVVLLFSILALICPVIIEIFTFWDEGFGKFYWKLVKHMIIVFTAMIALIYSSKDAISAIGH